MVEGRNHSSNMRRIKEKKKKRDVIGFLSKPKGNGSIPNVFQHHIAGQNTGRSIPHRSDVTVPVVWAKRSTMLLCCHATEPLCQMRVRNPSPNDGQYGMDSLLPHLQESRGTTRQAANWLTKIWTTSDPQSAAPRISFETWRRIADKSPPSPRPPSTHPLVKTQTPRVLGSLERLPKSPCVGEERRAWSGCCLTSTGIWEMTSGKTFPVSARRLARERNSPYSVSLRLFQRSSHIFHMKLDTGS